MLVLAAAVYSHLGLRWWLFFALFFAPDIAMLGYLKDARVGAWIYNTAHSYLAPALILGLSWQRWEMGVVLGLIWAAHIGFDRMLGYGLKFRTAFRDTHLNSVKAL